MSEFQRQFNDRIGRAVSKFLIHAEGEGLDAAELNGAVVLHFEGGALTGIEHSPFAVVDAVPAVTISEPVKARRATTAEVQAELDALGAQGLVASSEDDGHG